MTYRLFIVAAMSIVFTVQAHSVAYDSQQFSLSGQRCWAFGPLDNTVYFAEIEHREDRSKEFESLMDISGVDHLPITCVTEQIRKHREQRAEFLRQWSRSGMEIVDTTFMSDLDY